MGALLLCGWNGNYPEAPNYYVRIPKSDFYTNAPQPVLAAADGTETDRVTLAWEAVTGATEYVIWRGLSSDPASGEVIAQVKGTTNYADTSAVPGQVYYYWVVASGSGGYIGRGGLNWQEQLSGTDQHDAGSYLHIAGSEHLEAEGAFRLRGSTVSSSRIYAVQYRANLVAGIVTNLAQRPCSNAGGERLHRGVGTAPLGFYRLLLELPGYK